MLKAIFSAALAVMLCAASAQAQEAPAEPATPQAWREAARTDLEALHEMLRENTPVAVDDENPRIQRWFERGYRQARNRVRRVNDRSSYFYALAGYTNGFQDPHLSLRVNQPLQIGRWPGFIVTARGEDAIVFFRDEADAQAPALGARIVSCDGASPARLRERTVYPFVLNPQLALDRRSALTRLFLDRGNPYAPPPQRCIFEQNGARRTLMLNWRDLPEGDVYWTNYTAATAGPRGTFGITSPADGVTWIGIPSFGNDQGEALQALVDEISANAESIRNGRAVVIDVRGNGGGNSAWGQLIARALWGEAVIDAIPDANVGGATDWRASAGNLDYMAEAVPELTAQFGADSEIGQWVVQVRDGLAGAVERGEPLWRQRDAEDTGPIPAGGGYTRRRPNGPSPIPARVYMLSNGACASACLDFADTALHVPGVQLIGADTSGDGLLMEIRDEQLPSGLTSVSLPLKVYRGRPRGALESYRADAPYSGVWTDEAVRSWVLELIAQP